MKMLKNKMLLLAPIVAVVFLFIFSIVQIPSVKQAPKSLPIAVVNNDDGVDLPNKDHLNMGKTIVENIVKSSAADQEPVVQWVSVSDLEEVKAAMDHQEYYGAIVIPQDYSKKQASLLLPAPAPSSPEIQIYVNQGMNGLAANTVTQILNGVVDTISSNTSKQLLEGFMKQGGAISTEQAAILVSPITKTMIVVNQTGTQGNAPMALFQPLWMASIVGAVFVWMAMRKFERANRGKKLVVKSLQVLISAIVALAAGFGLSWIAEGLLGFDIPRFADTALFISLTSFSYVLMIMAVLSWLGMAGLPIFVLLLFFGAPLLAMSPEFMPSFYRDWIFSWLPMRYMVDGLRELFFFSKEWSWNHPTTVLVGIGIGSLAVLLLSVLKPATIKEAEHSLQAEQSIERNGAM